jgi:hypothetical protein
VADASTNAETPDSQGVPPAFLQIPAQPAAPSINPERIASVSTRLETGARDPLVGVGSVAHDTGGSKSYGNFGLNSLPGSSAWQFQSLYGQDLGLTAQPGTPQFDAQWKAAAATDPKKLRSAELDWYSRTVLPKIGANLQAVGVSPEAANDPRVVSYFADRSVQQGTGSISESHKHSARINEAWQASGGDPVAFLKNMSQRDLAAYQQDFPHAIASGVYPYNGHVNRIAGRENASLNIGAQPSDGSVVGQIVNAIASPVTRASRMADYQNGPSANPQYGNGPVAPANHDLAKALISGAFSESNSPGKGTMIGKLAQLITGMSMENQYNDAQRSFLAADPARGGSGNVQQVPQAQPGGQPGFLSQLVHALTGIPAQKPAPPPAPAPARPVQVPTAANPFAGVSVAPTQAGGATLPGSVTAGAPQAPAPQAAPQDSPAPAPSQAPAQAPVQPQSSAAQPFTLAPANDPAAARAKIEQTWPQNVIDYATSPQMRQYDPQRYEAGVKMANEKRAAVAAIDNAPNERFDFTDSNGLVHHMQGNQYKTSTEYAPPTDPAKIAGAKKAAESEAEVGPEGEKAYAKETGTYYGKKFNAIQTNAQTSMTELPQLRLLQKVMNDPAYTSGTGANALERLSSAARTMGLGSGETATLMQFADKLGKTGALENIEELGTQGAVRVPTLQLIAKSNYAPDNTPEANRAVVEIRARTAERTQEIADMATDYAAEHGGRIDAGFDKLVRQTYKDKPLFTPQEIEDYSSLFSGKQPAVKSAASSAPAAPAPAPAFPPGDVTAEMRRRGLLK